MSNFTYNLGAKSLFVPQKETRPVTKVIYCDTIRGKEELQGTNEGWANLDILSTNYNSFA